MKRLVLFLFLVTSFCCFIRAAEKQMSPTLTPTATPTPTPVPVQERPKTIQDYDTISLKAIAFDMQNQLQAILTEIQRRERK